MASLDERFLDACILGNADEAGRLLREGADIEARQEGLGLQRTGLLIACERGHDAVIALLLENGADKEARDQAQWTPLILASVSGRLSAIAQLLDHRADIEACTDNTFTALHMACLAGRPEVADLLIARGANIEARGQAQITPLMLAAARGHVAVVSVLAERRENIEAVAGGGLNALHLAAIYARLEACLLLVNPLGMDPAVLTSDGRSALSHYGVYLDKNDPAHPPVPADPDWHPRLTDAEKAEARAQLVAARDAFVLQKKRDENWARRRVFLQTLLAGGLRHSAAQKAEQAALQAAVDTSAVLSDVPRDREYLKQQVLGHEGVVRRVASFI